MTIALLENSLVFTTWNILVSMEKHHADTEEDNKKKIKKKVKK